MTQPAQSSGHEWVSIGEGMYGYCSCDTNYIKQVMTRPMWQAHVAALASQVPAQSSGHEWRDRSHSDCCECGWRCLENSRGYHSDLTCKEQHAAHIASVAQPAPTEEVGKPAQPQEVPAEQREIGWLVENVDSEWAYCQVKPYRAFKWTRDSVKALRFARREDAESAIMFMQSSESLKATEHSWSGYLAQAAQPRERTSTIAMGKMKPTELMAHEISLPEGELEQWYENPAAQPASTAKPAEDGLEAQCRRFVLENSGYGVETLTANLAAFVRASQAAREQKIVELEMELARLRVKPVVLLGNLSRFFF